jgi:hypothetical protein
VFAAMKALERDRFDPTSTARVFLVPGTQHGLLHQQATTTVGAVSLDAWLSAMVGGDPWSSVHP